MSGLNGVTWSILRLANWLSGRERREWLAAMAAETEAAGRQSLAWALGCLGAVIKDRLVADRWFLLALAVAPAVAFVVLVVLFLFVAAAARALGLPDAVTAPVMLVGPLPVAWLLGRMRPSYSSVLIGTLGFLAHQAFPLTAMWLLTGVPPIVFWTPNATLYNLPPIAGLLASWLVWIIGVGRGARASRTGDLTRQD